MRAEINRLIIEKTQVDLNASNPPRFFVEVNPIYLEGWGTGWRHRYEGEKPKFAAKWLRKNTLTLASVLLVCHDDGSGYSDFDLWVDNYLEETLNHAGLYS